MEPVIEFPNGFDERTAFEAESRGYYGNVIVVTENGNKYRLCFWDPSRLAQDLERAQELGECFVSEPGLVVIPRVTREFIGKAIIHLHLQGYFDLMLPIQSWPSASLAMLSPSGSTR